MNTIAVRHRHQTLMRRVGEGREIESLDKIKETTSHEISQHFAQLFTHTHTRTYIDGASIQTITRERSAQCTKGDDDVFNVFVSSHPPPASSCFAAVNSP